MKIIVASGVFLLCFAPSVLAQDDSRLKMPDSVQLQQLVASASDENASAASTSVSASTSTSTTAAATETVPETRGVTLGSGGKFYQISEFVLLGGHVLDMWTTAYGISHPASVSYDQLTFGKWQHVDTTRSFSEGQFPGTLVNTESAAQVVLMASVFDFAIWYGTHKLAQRGGKWEKLASLINTGRGFDHVVAGAINIHTRGVVERGLIPAGATNAAIH